jgi:hypothetical protein
MRRAFSWNSGQASEQGLKQISMREKHFKRLKASLIEVLNDNAECRGNKPASRKKNRQFLKRSADSILPSSTYLYIQPCTGVLNRRRGGTRTNDQERVLSLKSH